jgi:hypothetical protein
VPVGPPACFVAVVGTSVVFDSSLSSSRFFAKANEHFARPTQLRINCSRNYSTSTLFEIRNSKQTTNDGTMDTFFIRRLLFPPGVIALLVALFKVFGVFDMLFTGEDEPVRIAASVRMAEVPPRGEPVITSLRAVEPLATLSSPFSSTAATNSVPATSESATTGTLSTTPMVPPSLANDPAISENARHADDVPALPPITPLASNDVYVQDQSLPEVLDEPLSENIEVPLTEMAQLGEIPMAEELIVEQLSAEPQQ